MEKIDVPPDIPTKIIPNPKVSIIIPCYNKGQWIGECIKSCLNQSYKPYEIIVIDDGSTDNSPEVIQKYPVKYIRQENQGVASARNKGLGCASGDYFLLVDADDKISPVYLEKTLGAMTGDTQVVYTDVQMIGEWDWEHKYSGNMEELKTAQCIPSTMALCDSRCIDPFGAFDPTEHYEDYGFWIRLAFIYQGGLNFKHIPEPLCYYRRVKGSRIDELDKKREYGFNQLRERYGKYGVNPR
jgi:glycosyltransferase involved in cell wall biosynthesis